MAGHSPVTRYSECPSCLLPYKQGDLLDHAINSGHLELTTHLNRHLTPIPSCHWCAMEPLEEGVDEDETIDPSLDDHGAPDSEAFGYD